MTGPKSIAIITASSRTPRIGPSVAEFVRGTIEKQGNTDNVRIASIDVAEFNLLPYNETGIPAMMPTPEDYKTEHGRSWAGEIAKHDGYVLVSPEYNYGMPGSVKNAIDYLYGVWKGKPIAVVTYGIHGGTTASAQFEHSLRLMGLKVASVRPALPFSGGGQGSDLGVAMAAGQLGDATLSEWKENKVDDIVSAFNEVRSVVLETESA